MMKTCAEYVTVLSELDRRIEAHYEDALAELATRQRARIMVRAGWDPGVLASIRGAFELLIPRGAHLFSIM